MTRSAGSVSAPQTTTTTRSPDSTRHQRLVEATAAIGFDTDDSGLGECCGDARGQTTATDRDDHRVEILDLLLQFDAECPRFPGAGVACSLRIGVEIPGDPHVGAQRSDPGDQTGTGHTPCWSSSSLSVMPSNAITGVRRTRPATRP